MRTAIAMLACLIFAGLPAIGDGVISLDLDTPALQQVQQQSETRSVSSVKGQVSQNQRIGRVGLVTVDKSNIHAHPNAKSRIYSTCLKDVPLAIVATSGSWYGVLMIDGSTGWIEASHMKLLDYNIIAPAQSSAQPPSRTGNYTSRGGFDRNSEQYNPEQYSIIQTAMQYMGVPYVYGGTSTSNGIDCSAFVRTVFAQHGVRLPRVARDQANVGTAVSADELQPGDRLYFACKHSYVDHCGIYMGDGYFIHASASRGGVAVDSLSKAFYSKNLVVAMR